MSTRTAQMTHAHPQGVKRPHSDDLDNAQRLTKRFHLLKLEQQEKAQLWTPPEQTTPSDSNFPRPSSDLMNIDDTTDRVFIQDLDAELANVSDTDEEDRVIFLPDIERRLNKVPRQALARERDEEASRQQVVLYSIPHSLSVSKEQDSVRKAILEARARVREQQRKTDMDSIQQDIPDRHIMTSGQSVVNGVQYQTSNVDPDAMDIG